MGTQMGIPHKQLVQLQAEGVTMVDELINSEGDTIEHITEKIWKPAVREPYPNPNVAPIKKIPMPPFVLELSRKTYLWQPWNFYNNTKK